MTRQGSVLVISLLLGTLVVVLALAVAGSRPSLYKGALLSARAHQAEALARAGLADATAKLAYDLDFPPRNSNDQELFSYTEDVISPDSGEVVGFYLVTIDSTHRVEPFQVVGIESVGIVGERTLPLASWKLRCYLDLADRDRANPSLSNDNLFEIIHWSEE